MELFFWELQLCSVSFRTRICIENISYKLRAVWNDPSCTPPSRRSTRYVSSCGTERIVFAQKVQLNSGLRAGGAHVVMYKLIS